MFLEDLSNPGKSPPQLTLFQSLFTHKLGCSFNTKRQIPQNREDREVFFGRRCKIRHQGEQSHPSSLSRSCQDTTPDQKALPLAVFRYVYAHDIFLFFAYLSYLFTKTWTPNEKKTKVVFYVWNPNTKVKKEIVGLREAAKYLGLSSNTKL